MQVRRKATLSILGLSIVCYHESMGGRYGMDVLTLQGTIQVQSDCTTKQRTKSLQYDYYCGVLYNQILKLKL